MTQWFSCATMLPMHGQRVLVYRQSVVNLIRKSSITISQCHHTTSGPIWDCDQNQWALRRVTHWMPLPDAPVTPQEAA